ncbi:MAG: metal-dependent hydrolase [Candidatus Bathyarchaeia archaeon]
MFAPGHFALGYMLARLTARITKTNINIPLVLALSVISDIDLLSYHSMTLFFIRHRGPTHSILVITILFIPMFIVYRKAALPYFVGMIQHPLLGDLITGGKVQLLWPLTTTIYGLGIDVLSPLSITLEWLAFLTAVFAMFKTRDIRVFLQPHPSNLILIIPLFTVLAPLILGLPDPVPAALVPPHLAYFLLFIAALSADFREKCRLKLNRLGLHKKVY